MNNTIIDEAYVDNDLALTSNAKNYLVTTSRWGKFLAILGFIFSIIAVIAGLVMISNLAQYSEIPGLGDNFMLYMGIGYIVFAFIYGFLSYLLFSFCSNAKNAVDHSNSIALENSLNQLKKLFVIMGASTIAFIVLYAIFFIVMIAGLSSKF